MLYMSNVYIMSYDVVYNTRSSIYIMSFDDIYEQCLHEL